MIDLEPGLDPQPDGGGVDNPAWAWLARLFSRIFGR